MAMSNINIRTDEEVKQQAEQLFESLGMSMSTAVNVFLRQAIRVDGLPFEVKADEPNAATKAAFEEGKRLAADPHAKGYRSMDALREALDE